MMDPLDAIRDPQLSDAELVRRLAALGPVTAPAASWNDLAGDARYRPRHRAHAIVQLFRRHLSPGASLGALATATWLDRSTIAIIAALAGKLPFAYDPDDTVAVVHVVPALSAEIQAIYLRVDLRVDLRLEGGLARDQILAALAGSGPAPVVRGYAILDGHGAVWASAP